MECRREGLAFVVGGVGDGRGEERGVRRTRVDEIGFAERKTIIHLARCISKVRVDGGATVGCWKMTLRFRVTVGEEIFTNGILSFKISRCLVTHPSNLITFLKIIPHPS